jgi:hypothetical protein
MPEVGPGVGTIWVNLAANVESFISGIGTATSAVEKFGNTTKQQASGITNFGAQLKQNWVAVAASAGIAATAIEVLARQQQQMSLETYKLSQTFNVSSDEMRKYVVNLAGVTETAKEFLAIMEQGRLQGLTTLESLADFVEFWDTVADSMGRSGAEFAQNSQYLKAFGIEAKDVGVALDAVGFITNSTTVTIDEFFMSMSRTSAAVEKSGITLNEYAMAIAAIKERGASSRQAIQQMNEGLAEMARTGISVGEAFNISAEQQAEYTAEIEAGGDKVVAAAEKWNSLRTPIENLTTWLGNMTYQFAGALPALSQFAAVLYTIGMSATIYGNIDKMARAVTGFVATLMGISAVAPALASIAVVAPTVATALSSVAVGSSGAYLALVSLEAQLAVTEGTMIGTAGASTGLAASLGAIAIPLGIIIAAIAAFAVAYKYNIGGIKTITDNTIKASGDALDGFAKAVKRVTDNIGQDMDKLLTSMGEKTAAVTKITTSMTAEQYRAAGRSDLGLGPKMSADEFSAYQVAREAESARQIASAQLRIVETVAAAAALKSGKYEGLEKYKALELELKAIAADTSLSFVEGQEAQTAAIYRTLDAEDLRIKKEAELKAKNAPLTLPEEKQLKAMVLQTTAEWDSMEGVILKSAAAVRVFFQAHEKFNDLKANLEALKGAYAGVTSGIEGYQDTLVKNKTIGFDTADAVQKEVEARAAYLALYKNATPEVKKWFDMVLAGNNDEAAAYRVSSKMMKDHSSEVTALENAYRNSVSSTHELEHAQEDLASNTFDTTNQFTELAMAMHEAGYVGEDQMGKWEQFATQLGTQWATELLHVETVAESLAKLEEQFRAAQFIINVDNTAALEKIGAVGFALLGISGPITITPGTTPSVSSQGPYAPGQSPGAQATSAGWTFTGQTKSSIVDGQSVVFEQWKSPSGNLTWRQMTGPGAAGAPGSSGTSARDYEETKKSFIIATPPPVVPESPGRKVGTTTKMTKAAVDEAMAAWNAAGAKGTFNEYLVTIGQYYVEKPETTKTTGGVGELSAADKALLAQAALDAQAIRDAEATQTGKTWTADEYRKAMGWDAVNTTVAGRSQETLDAVVKANDERLAREQKFNDDLAAENKKREEAAAAASGAVTTAAATATETVEKAGDKITEIAETTGEQVVAAAEETKTAVIADSAAVTTATTAALNSIAARGYALPSEIIMPKVPGEYPYAEGVAPGMVDISLLNPAVETATASTQDFSEELSLRIPESAEMAMASMVEMGDRVQESGYIAEDMGTTATYVFSDMSSGFTDFGSVAEQIINAIVQAATAGLGVVQTAVAGVDGACVGCADSAAILANAMSPYQYAGGTGASPGSITAPYVPITYGLAPGVGPVIQPTINAPLTMNNPVFQQPVDVSMAIAEWQYAQDAAMKRAGYF